MIKFGKDDEEEDGIKKIVLYKVSCLGMFDD